MERRTGLSDLVGHLLELLEGAEPSFTEEEVEDLLGRINRAAGRAAGRERDAALRDLGRALYDEDLDEVSEALLIAACAGPIAAGGNAEPVAGAIVSFAEVTLPVCCSYYLIMAGTTGDGESMPEAGDALAPLVDRFPEAGFEITALQWTAEALEALVRHHREAAEEMRQSIFVIPPLYALAPFMPAALSVLRALDPDLGALRGAPAPAEERAPRDPGPEGRVPRGRGQGRPSGRPQPRGRT